MKRSEDFLGKRISQRRARPVCLFALAFSVLLSGCGGDGNGSGGGTGATNGVGGSGAQVSCQSSGATGEMVAVAAGPFLMGCNSATDNQCKPEEQPGRTVTLKAFQIDKFEVTQDQYTACIDAGACDNPTCEWNCDQMQLPATCVTWPAAKKFCAWAGKRLPTEAEWEKAARGTDGRKYPWGSEEPTCQRANMIGCIEGPSAVGAYASGASPSGALDMGGNMVEMVSDWYDENYYQSAPTTDPQGPATPPSGTRYTGRGGGWKSEADWLRASVRDWYVPTDAGKSLGFRCAK
jgi:formylglycine-generating enzyme required for sulfatase activity